MQTQSIETPRRQPRSPSQQAPAPPAAALPFATDDARYQAVAGRDPRAEGYFLYSVATTGVYCRPTCAARLARRENVAFHASADEAEKAGFRACKRCRPREPPQAERHARVIQAARERIESSEEPVSLADLAAAAQLSAFHFHRLFKQHVGMTPREYAAACRLQRFGEAVRDGATVTAAIYEAGYSSSSRFYEAGGSALGMSPSELRRGADGLEMRAVVRRCSLGLVLVAATARGVCAVSFGDDAEALRAELRQRFPRALVRQAGDEARDAQAVARPEAQDEALERLADRVVDLVDSAGVAADIPLDLVGTAFQQRVWRALRDIPRGETTTYAEIARRIGAPQAVRAVGTACGKNPVAVAVPCHRVVRGDGALGGYRWGLERKTALLAQERAR